MKVITNKDAVLNVLMPNIWSTRGKKKQGAEGHKHYVPIFVCVFFLILILYWSIVDLQCCVSLRYIAK